MKSKEPPDNRRFFFYRDQFVRLTYSSRHRSFSVISAFTSNADNVFWVENACISRERRIPFWMSLSPLERSSAIIMMAIRNMMIMNMVPIHEPVATFERQYADINARAGEKTTAANEDVISLPSTRALPRLMLMPANAATNSVPAGSGVALSPILPGRLPENKTKVNTMAIKTASTDCESMSSSVSAISHFFWHERLCKKG